MQHSIIIQQSWTNVKNQDTVELRIADKEEGFSMEFWGDPPDDYWDIVTVTGRRKAVCEQFSWCRYSGIKFHFCGDESAGQLRKDGADDRETADLFSASFIRQQVSGR